MFAKKIIASIAAVAMMLSLTACGVNITALTLPETTEVEVGDTASLTPEYAADTNSDADALADAAAKLTLTWTSSDEAVATVDAEGKVTALAPGGCDVTVATEDGKLTATCHVVVLDPAASDDDDTDASKSEPTSEATDATSKDTKTDSKSTSKTDSKKNGSTATGGETVSGGNNTPAPTPVPAPDPTPAPDTGNNSGNTPPSGGIVDGGLDTVIPGGGITDQDGGDAETVERPDPAPETNTPPSGGIVDGGLDNVIPGGGITDQDGGDAETVERPASVE